MIFLWIFFELFIFFTGLMRKASERPESTEIKQESREPRRVRLRVTEINRSTTLPEAPRVGCPMDCIATDVCWHLIERERQRLRRPWLYLRLLLEQDGPQDENAGEGGLQFRLFERSELRNCRRSQCLRGARKSCLKYNHADVYTRSS